MTTTTFDRLCDILVQAHKLPLDRLTPEAPLDSLGIDSLGVVELLWQVEETFKIKLPATPPDLQTLGDVVRFVDELAARPGVLAAPEVRLAAAAVNLRAS